MKRRMVPLVVATLALLAFAVAAGSLDTVASDGPRLEGGEDVTSDHAPTGSANSSSGGSGASGGSSCRNCGLDLSLRGLLADRLPKVPPLVLLSAATLGCVLLALIARGGERVVGAGETNEDAPAPPRPATGTTRATIQYDNPPADHPIYRAWRETLGELDVPRPITTTPGERAEIARERGWDADSVTTLTELFRRARYGEESLDDREVIEGARAAADRLREER